jgi:hypothetical protein
MDADNRQDMKSLCCPKCGDMFYEAKDYDIHMRDFPHVSMLSKAAPSDVVQPNGSILPSVFYTSASSLLPNDQKPVATPTEPCYYCAELKPYIHKHMGIPAKTPAELEEFLKIVDAWKRLE